MCDVDVGELVSWPMGRDGRRRKGLGGEWTKKKSNMH